MPNFNSIGSGVSEPQVAEYHYLPLTGGIALTTVYTHYRATLWDEFTVPSSLVLLIARSLLGIEKFKKCIAISIFPVIIFYQTVT